MDIPLLLVVTLLCVVVQVLVRIPSYVWWFLLLEPVTNNKETTTYKTTIPFVRLNYLTSKIMQMHESWMKTLIWESLIQIDLLWKTCKNDTNIHFATSCLHKLSKVIVFHLQSVHQQYEELSLKHGFSHTMLKNDLGNISVWNLSSPPWEITPHIDLSMVV